MEDLEASLNMLASGLLVSKLHLGYEVRFPSSEVSRLSGEINFSSAKTFNLLLQP